MTPAEGRADGGAEHRPEDTDWPEGTGEGRGLPKRVPAPVPRGPRPRPGLFGPDPAEPGPIAALRRTRRAAVPLERVRRALEEIDEQGEPSHGDDGARGE